MNICIEGFRNWVKGQISQDSEQRLRVNQTSSEIIMYYGGATNWQKK
jgi:outer membrane biogenesis lipoprotein LolB